MQKVSNDKMVISIKNISKIRYHILEYIDIEGTIDSVLKYHQLEPHHLIGPITLSVNSKSTRSQLEDLSVNSNRLDLVAQLAEYCHWTNIPKVAGSIPTVVRQTFQLARLGCTLKVTSQT